MFKRLFSRQTSSDKKPTDGDRVQVVMPEPVKTHSCGHLDKSFSTRKDGTTICRKCREDELNA